MAITTNRNLVTAIMLLASAVLIGMAVVFGMLGFKIAEWPSACFSLLPFVIVAATAAGVSKRGRIVGFCTWLSGLVSVGALYLLGYMGSQQALQQHAWTAAALSMGFAVFAAFPASIVGSLVGLVVGRALSKTGTTSDSNQIRKVL